MKYGSLDETESEDKEKEKAEKRREEEPKTLCRWGEIGGFGPDGGAAAEPGPGGGDGGLVETLRSSESEVAVGSTGGLDGSGSGAGRIGVGVKPASGADGNEDVDSTGSETEVVGLGGGGISVDGQEETGVEAMRRRLTLRSVAGGGEEEGRDGLAM
eukprot:s2382_g13.t1